MVRQACHWGRRQCRELDRADNPRACIIPQVRALSPPARGGTSTSPVTIWASHLSSELKCRLYKNWYMARKKVFTRYAKKHANDNKSTLLTFSPAARLEWSLMSGYIVRTTPWPPTRAPPSASPPPPHPFYTRDTLIPGLSRVENLADPRIKAAKSLSRRAFRLQEEDDPWGRSRRWGNPRDDQPRSLLRKLYYLFVNFSML
jgi:Ribosomal protein L3